MAHYFNEFDPHAAAWLRELIRAGHLPAGDVDERDIREVQADDLRGYVSAHFFAGIGGWPLALRLAGWDDARPCWTGSCPCQPYSTAGRGKGDEDPRNLWPEFFRLIRQCRPECVFGEQVEGAIRHGWLDRVSADLEGEGYAVGAVVLGAHSVGAPHIRQRLYWVAESVGEQQRRHLRDVEGEARPPTQAGHGRGVGDVAERGGTTGGLADAGGDRRHHEQGICRRKGRTGKRGNQPHVGGPTLARGVEHPAGDGWEQGCGYGERDDRPAMQGGESEPGRTDGGVDPSGVALGDATGERSGATGPVDAQEATGRRATESGDDGGMDAAGVAQGDTGGVGPQGVVPAGAAAGAVVGADGGFWADSVLIPCRDGKYRRVPTQPGLFPLAHGVSGRVAVARPAGLPPAADAEEDVREVNRVGALRGVGNAIVPEDGAEFVRAYLEVLEEGGGLT